MTIGALKEKIAGEMSTPAEQQKLIAYGKQLEDNDKTLQEYNIKADDFLVLFVTKAKAPAKAKPEEPASTTSPQVAIQQPAQP